MPRLCWLVLFATWFWRTCDLITAWCVEVLQFKCLQSKFYLYLMTHLSMDDWVPFFLNVLCTQHLDSCKQVSPVRPTVEIRCGPRDHLYPTRWAISVDDESWPKLCNCEVQRSRGFLVHVWKSSNSCHFWLHCGPSFNLSETRNTCSRKSCSEVSHHRKHWEPVQAAAQRKGRTDDVWR